MSAPSDPEGMNGLSWPKETIVASGAARATSIFRLVSDGREG